MAIINSLTNNAYYQLSNPSAGPGGTGQTSSGAALLQALGDTSSTTSNSDAYLLDLSPQAQQLLNGGGTIPSTTATGASSSSFVLTPQQQQAITTILEKYADAPQTQATFDDIQNDLSAVGLGPQQLAGIDQAKNFNPTQILVDDMNGDYSDADAMASGANDNEQAKSANYMQQIISQWDSLSGNASSSGTTTASGSSVTPTSGTGGA